jgi:hypothetical protein
MSEERKATYEELRYVVLFCGRKSDFSIPECDSWASSNAVEMLMDSGLLEPAWHHGNWRLTERGEGVYQRLVIGQPSPTLRELANPGPEAISGNPGLD